MNNISINDKSESSNIPNLPASKLEQLLEAMTAPLTAFYADPENQRKFEVWLANRQAAKKD